MGETLLGHVVSDYRLAASPADLEPDGCELVAPGIVQDVRPGLHTSCQRSEEHSCLHLPGLWLDGLDLSVPCGDGPEQPVTGKKLCFIGARDLDPTSPRLDPLGKCGQCLGQREFLRSVGLHDHRPRSSDITDRCRDGEPAGLVLTVDKRELRLKRIVEKGCQRVDPCAGAAAGHDHLRMGVDVLVPAVSIRPGSLRPGQRDHSAPDSVRGGLFFDEIGKWNGQFGRPVLTGLVRVLEFPVAVPTGGLGPEFRYNPLVVDRPVCVGDHLVGNRIAPRRRGEPQFELVAIHVDRLISAAVVHGRLAARRELAVDGQVETLPVVTEEYS